MQIRTGSADVTNGSATVVASTGNDWTDAQVGSLFSITGTSATGVLYTVAAITNPASSGSGKWELTLSAPYAGTTATGQPYQITRDFTPLLSLPLIYRGDTDTAALINRAFALLDQAITGVSAVPERRVTLGFVADTGVVGDNQTLISDQLVAMDADAVIFGGDNFYPASGTYNDAWSIFAPVLPTAIVARGNHDDDEADVEAEYAGRFPQYPRACRYYNVVLGAGLVEVFVLHSGRKSNWTSSEPDGNTIGSQQHAWFVAAIAASTATYKIVVMHHPFMTSATGSNRYDTGLDWDFESHGVDLVLHGHNHINEGMTVNGSLQIIGLGGTSNPNSTCGITLRGDASTIEQSALDWVVEGRPCAAKIIATENNLSVQIFDVLSQTTLLTYAIKDGSPKTMQAWEVEILPPGSTLTLTSLLIGTMPRHWIFDRGIRVSFPTDLAIDMTIEIYKDNPSTSGGTLLVSAIIPAGESSYIIPREDLEDVNILEGTKLYIEFDWEPSPYAPDGPTDGITTHFLGRFVS